MIKRRNFLFEPMPATRLATLRIAVGLYVVYHFLSQRRGLLALADEPATNWDPVGPATLLGGPPTPEMMQLWFWSSVALGVLFVLGAGQRFVGPLFGASVLFFFAWRTSWQKIYHSDNLFTMQVVVLAFAPTAAAWSVDAWATARFGDRLSWLRWRPAPESTHWWYGWPIRLMCGVTAITYLLAGLAKVWGEAGWSWADGTNLRDQIGADALYKDLIHHTVSTDVTALAYHHTDVLTALAVITLIVEIGAPYALLHPWIARLWVFGTWCMHLGIATIMHIVFVYPCTGIPFLCFLEPETWVVAAMRWNRRLIAGLRADFAPPVG